MEEPSLLRARGCLAHPGRRGDGSHKLLPLRRLPVLGEFPEEQRAQSMAQGQVWSQNQASLPWQCGAGAPHMVCPGSPSQPAKQGTRTRMTQQSTTRLCALLAVATALSGAPQSLERTWPLTPG